MFARDPVMHFYMLCRLSATAQDAANEQQIIEIHVIVLTGRSGTAVGNDNISMNSIKESTDIIINFSSYMHNRPSSIISGVVSSHASAKLSLVGV